METINVINVGGVDKEIEDTVARDSNTTQSSQIQTLTNNLATTNSNLSSEVSARTSADATINARIDNIVAPSGEAPSPAEVTDARVGANGTTYASLGNSIRGQHNIVEDMIDGMAETVRVDTKTHTVNANLNGQVYPLGFEAMEAGDYYISFYLDEDVTASRLCFLVQGINTETGNTQYVYLNGTLFNKKGLHIDVVRLPWNSNYRFAVWAVDNTSFTYKNYRVSKAKPTFNKNDILNQINLMSNEVFWYGVGIRPTIEWTGSNNAYLVTLPNSNNIRFAIRLYTERVYIGGVDFSQAGAQFTISHDQYLVFDLETNQIKIITGNVDLNTNKYILCLYNSAGNLAGPWAKYNQCYRYDEENELWFYGFDQKPHFSIDYAAENRPITVTFGRFPRVNSKRINNDPPRIILGDSTYGYENAPTFVVPHNSSLVFDRATNEVSVVSGINIPYSPQKTVLFYNSMGSINGLWRIYWLQQLIEEQAKESLVVPDYYKSHITSKAKTICGLIASSTKTESFVFVTDIHYPANAMHSPALVDSICRQTGIDIVQLNGDYINDESDKESALENVARVTGLYQYPSVKTFASVGNHEYNNPGASQDPEYLAKQLTSAELRWALCNRFMDNITIDPNSLAYYYDDVVHKFRFFVGEVDYGSGHDINSDKWIASQLENVPSGYSVVIIYHTLIHYDDETGEPFVTAPFVENIMNAVRTKTSYTYDGVTYNYSNIDYELVCALCGDYHLDMEYMTSAGVPIVATTTDSFQQSSHGTILTRTRFTTNEQAFDVVTIDTNAKKLYLTRIGAGLDREITYDT